MPEIAFTGRKTVALVVRHKMIRDFGDLPRPFLVCRQKHVQQTGVFVDNSFVRNLFSGFVIYYFELAVRKSVDAVYLHDGIDAVPAPFGTNFEHDRIFLPIQALEIFLEHDVGSDFEAFFFFGIGIAIRNPVFVENAPEWINLDPAGFVILMIVTQSEMN